ncbi:response regulator transcription factor [Catenovulum sp. SX2]|uniref:response regulator transcription factor n=1 Tax=Catenovulum sp. SX2 TaxID=3398614 RepID=UPI003F87C048
MMDVDSLSKRELAVFNLIAQGKPNKEVADELFISERTVKFHCANIYKKLQIKNKMELVFMSRALSQFN